MEPILIAVIVLLLIVLFWVAKSISVKTTTSDTFSFISRESCSNKGLEKLSCSSIAPFALVRTNSRNRSIRNGLGEERFSNRSVSPPNLGEKEGLFLPRRSGEVRRGLTFAFIRPVNFLPPRQSWRRNSGSTFLLKNDFPQRFLKFACRYSSPAIAKLRRTVRSLLPITSQLICRLSSFACCCSISSSRSVYRSQRPIPTLGSR